MNENCYDWTWNSSPPLSYDNTSACAVADAPCTWFTADGTPLTVTGEVGNCTSCQAGCSQESDCLQFAWQGSNLTAYDDNFLCTGVHSSPPGDHPYEPPAAGQSQGGQ